MRIVIDRSHDRIELREPEEFSRFSVVIEGSGPEPLADLVARVGLGRLADDGQHVVVDPAAVRALASDAATPTWDEGFAAMVSYAAGKGWVEADGGIQAHIE
jgi:hypothetical protein